MSSIRASVTELFSRASHIAVKGRSWGPTFAAWGGSAALVVLYLTDWKVVLQKVPFIKGKFDHEVPK